MKIKALDWTARIIAVLVLAASVGALAQIATPMRYTGEIDAYSPQTSTTGPYQVHGLWTLQIRGDSGKADFSAALNMELSDGWVLTKNGGNFDPSARGAHTHHVTLVNADVTPIENGIRISGMATITLNGKAAPISPSMLVVEITGNSDVEYSNITLTFQTPAANHFGSTPLPGVVRSFN